MVDAVRAAPATATPMEAIAASLYAASSLLGGLRGRGVREPQASLAAEAGVAVFRVAFERRLAAGKAQPLTSVTRECTEALAALTSTDA